MPLLLSGDFRTLPYCNIFGDTRNCTSMGSSKVSVIAALHGIIHQMLVSVLESELHDGRTCGSDADP